MKLTSRSVAGAALVRQAPWLVLVVGLILALSFRAGQPGPGDTGLVVTLVGASGGRVERCTASLLREGQDPRAQRSLQRDCQGALTWEALPPGTWTLRVQADGAARIEQEVTLLVGVTTVLGPLRLQPGGSVVGAVRTQGAAVEGATVWVDGLGRSPQPSGRNGRFLLRGLPIGTNVLRGRGPNGEEGRGEVEVVQNTTVRLDLDLRAVVPPSAKGWTDRPTEASR